MSKCYSIQTVNDKNVKRVKGISKNFSEKNHTHKFLKKFCLMKMNIIKLNFIEYL